jgi:hypothetical protein
MQDIRGPYSLEEYKDILKTNKHCKTIVDKLFSGSTVEDIENEFVMSLEDCLAISRLLKAAKEFGRSCSCGGIIYQIPDPKVPVEAMGVCDQCGDLYVRPNKPVDWIEIKYEVTQL